MVLFQICLVLTKRAFFLNLNSFYHYNHFCILYSLLNCLVLAVVTNIQYMCHTYVPYIYVPYISCKCRLGRSGALSEWSSFCLFEYIISFNILGDPPPNPYYLFHSARMKKTKEIMMAACWKFVSARPRSDIYSL